MAKIRDEVKQRILDRNDIVEVIGEHVSLKQAGARFKALCPFHKEKTASFMVNPERQIFHCFGCGVGGDVIKFIQLHENLDFPGALEYLARRAGIRLEWTGGERSPSAWDQQLQQDAMEFYCQGLGKETGPRLRSLLKRRGLEEDTLKRFQIGYADPQWESLLEYFGRKGVEPEKLVRCGLAAPGRSASQYRDWFRDRLLFPIFTVSGQVVGFGGRALDDTPPKYLNSPETEKFQKGRLLYALNLAKKAIGKTRTALLAEGYMDVVALHRHGFTHSVGGLGTALTIDQARLLKRYAERCVLVYDGDEAGRKAALRATDIFRDVDLPCRVVQLPEGVDPDDLLSQEGAAGLQRLVDGAPEAFEYRLAVVCGQCDLNALEGRRKAARELGRWILEVPSEMARAEYWQRLSDRLGAPVHTLQREVRGRTPGRVRRTRLEGDPEASGPEARPVEPLTQAQLAKLGLAALLLDSAEFAEPIRAFWTGLDRSDSAGDLLDPLVDRLVALHHRKKPGKAGPEALRRQLEEDGFGEPLARIFAGDPLPENRQKAFEQYCQQIRYHQLQQKIARQLEHLKENDQKNNPEFQSDWMKQEFRLEQERYSLDGSA